ncbi:hypothetical protein B6K89_15865 [Bacillus subtilis]|nr:hypothetical protein B6K89_15865 [Bacillus subtilis]
MRLPSQKFSANRKRNILNFQKRNNDFDLHLLLSMKKKQKNRPFVISKRDFNNQKIKTAAKFLFKNSTTLIKTI